MDKEVLRQSEIASDLKKIFEFKKDIYTTEKLALLPMRECLPYTSNIQQSLSNLVQIKDDVIYAREMCDSVVQMYEDMEVPELSKPEYTQVLEDAKLIVKETYILRGQAMECSIKLIESKNPMYITKITSYLKESDKEINAFKEEISNLKENIQNN